MRAMQTRRSVPRSSFLRTLTTSVVMGALGFSLAQNGSAEILLKDGQKIAFMGDSITAGGWGNPAGYVRLVV
ncbi:MAG: hypothetical protein EB141_21585, partial [Verrucomicrobia bacterium]|nr:hypothetical protein [Verrucomicrobiota bacterium]